MIITLEELDSGSIRIENDERTVESFLPFPDKNVRFKGRINIGPLVSLILNSKELDQYHKYYAYSLRTKSLYSKCRSWNDTISLGGRNDIDWFVLSWKVTQEDQYVDFIPKLLSVEFKDYSKVISETDIDGYEGYEFVPIQLNESFQFTNRNLKKRFKVKDLLSCIFSHI